MRLVSFILLLVWVFAVGCAKDKPASTPGSWSAGQAPANSPQTTADRQAGRMLVTPSNATKGKVAFVNPNARYVVLSFPIGTVPALESRFNVYRDGLKVGEVKVTGPTMDNNTVGDITVGDAQTGDEVRTN